MKSEVADVMKLDKEYKLFIGGKWVSASDGKTFTTVCSATGEKLAECAEATKEDVDAAVKAAEEAFPAWAAVMPADRAKILNKIADIIEENIPRLAMIEAMDVGKPIRETTIIDIPTTADQFRYYAGLIRGGGGFGDQGDRGGRGEDARRDLPVSVGRVYARPVHAGGRLFTRQTFWRGSLGLRG